MANVTLKGNLGKVRELAFNKSDGNARLGFSVGEPHNKPDGNGGWTDEGTTWWNVTVFGRQAETLAEVLEEGAKQKVVVSGRSRTREYEYEGERRTSLDVVADTVGLIPKNPTQGGQNAAQNAPQGQGWGNTQNPPQQPAQGQQADPWSGGRQQAADWGNPIQDQEPPF